MAFAIASIVRSKPRHASKCPIVINSIISFSFLDNLDVLEMSVATSVKRIALSTYFCGTRLRVISVLQRIG